MNRLDSLEPDFRIKVQQLLLAAEAVTGRKWIITAGRRTMAEQRAIYAQGRTAPGKVVSNAFPGSSAHNYGLAADLAPLNVNLQGIDWNANRVLWENMADVAVEMGLTAGYYFKTIFDAPHVECASWKEKRKLWIAGKLEVA